MQIRLSVLGRLFHQHESILDLIEGLPDVQLRKQLYPGKWSIFENLVHLQTYQHMFINRVRLIVAGETPVFMPYTAEADPLFHDNCHLPVREVMEDLFVTRKGLSTEILSFKEADLMKEARHATYGKMNLLLWLHFFLLHEAHHLFTIFRLSMELRKDSD